MVTWAAIPENHINGILQGYVTMIDGSQGLSPGRGHCVLFLGKTPLLLSRTGQFNAGDELRAWWAILLVRRLYLHLTHGQMLGSDPRKALSWLLMERRHVWGAIARTALHRMGKEMKKNKELKVNEVKARKRLTFHRKRKYKLNAPILPFASSQLSTWWTLGLNAHCAFFYSFRGNIKCCCL